jgi:hypothetical protein
VVGGLFRGGRIVLWWEDCFVVGGLFCGGRIVLWWERILIYFVKLIAHEYTMNIYEVVDTR